MAAKCLSTADEVKLLSSSGLCILLVTLLQATIKEGYPLHHLGKSVIPFWLDNSSVHKHKCTGKGSRTERTLSSFC